VRPGSRGVAAEVGRLDRVEEDRLDVRGVGLAVAVGVGAVIDDREVDVRFALAALIVSAESL
jgi:hypothetical protein